LYWVGWFFHDTMGLLALGTALDWEEAKKRSDQVRKWGIEQLLAIWNRAKGKERDALLWGDEVATSFIELIALFGQMAHTGSGRVPCGSYR
jgi:hypothetical protein